MRIIIVEENETDERIDKYLINKMDISRSKVQKLIEDGGILVNGNTIKNSYIVRIDDEITINEYLPDDTDILPEDIELDILYEDEYLMVVNKPSGMVVHPALGHYSKTLVNALLYHTKLSNNDIRPGIVHRIDKDTSGLLLVAKDDDTHMYLSEQISKKKVDRIYVALVHGVILHETGTIDAPIGRDINNRKKMSVTDLNAKEAITHFKVLERFKDTTLIECKLETGRTHQIRVHMAYIGHPIVNDSVYGHKKTVNEYGQMLHAKSIGFIHPKTGLYLKFEVEVEEEFNKIISMFK